MPECTLTDFAVTIQGEQAPFAVLARYRDAQQTGTLHASISDAAWRDAPRILEETMTTGDVTAITEIGARLFRALIHGPLRDLWVMARADLDHERMDGLRVRLDMEAAGVAALPWEALYDPGRGTVFAADSRIALVRAVTSYSRLGRPRRLRVDLPVRILIAAPDDPDGEVDSRSEIAATEQVLATLGAPHVQVEVMTGKFNITQLRRRLLAYKPAVLHFIGHGAPDGLWLWLRDQQILIGPDSWRSVLSHARSVKLVLLNACSAARTTGPDGFNGVGMKLLQAGVPAVIAMQSPIRDDAAISFAHSLYEELICGVCPGLVDLAVGAARSDLYALNPGDFSYGAPVLWLNSRDGRIFNLNGLAEDDLGDDAGIESLDLSAESAWVKHIAASVDVYSLPAEFQFVRAKWQALLDELHSLLAQLRSLLDPDHATALANKLTEYRRNKAAALRLKRLIEDTQD